MRFVKFALVGVTNTAVAFAVFDLMTLAFHAPALVGNALGWLVGFGNSFLWNWFWTFRDRRHLPAGHTMVRFAGANLVALGVSTAIIVALQASFRIHNEALYFNLIEAVAVGAALVANYFISAKWVFVTR